MLSCSKTLHNSSEQTIESKGYKMGEKTGCCQQYARYIDIYDGKRIKEQIVFEYMILLQRGMPTKYVFNYDKKGKLLYCEKYIATIKDDYEMGLTNIEQQFFSSRIKQTILLVQSGTFNSIKDTTAKFLDIKGFRKPKEKDVTQEFPLVKHGTKIKIQ